MPSNFSTFLGSLEQCTPYDLGWLVSRCSFSQSVSQAGLVSSAAPQIATLLMLLIQQNK